MKLHKDEVEIAEDLLKRLLKIQCPTYSSETLSPLASSGTENRMFLLGQDKLIRLPRVEGSVSSLEKESKWLPVLSRELKTPIPRIIFEGKACDDYPFPWLIISKLEGEEISAANSLDQSLAPKELATFLGELREVSTTGGPVCSRGMSLQNRDTAVQKSILLLAEDYDTGLLTKLWKDSLEASDWRENPLWLHGDLHQGNLLVKNGKISAILDFGLCGVGDPSCDLMVAWTLLDQGARREFFEMMQADSDSIKKARGWALSMGILGYPYYKKTNPSFALIAKSAMDEVIKDSFS